MAGRLYPRVRREKYGEEFDALREDAAADWRQFWNVTYGACAMQLTNGMAYLKVAGNGRFPAYSCRSATMGSMRVALRAGTQIASSAAAPSMIATMPNVSGSLGRTP